MRREMTPRWFRIGWALAIAILLLAGCADLAATSTPTPARQLGAVLRMYTAHSMRVMAIAWSPDGKLVASGSEDQTVQVWDATTGAHIVTYARHRDGISAVAWSPDGKYIASGALDATTQVWEARTGRALLTYQGQHATVNSI